LSDDDSFRASYLGYLQAEPDVSTANAALRALLARFKSAPTDH
jgi:hypothetical protein